MGAVELVLRRIYPEVVCAKVCSRWKMMMLSVVYLSSLRVNKDDTEISIRAHELAERHDEAGREEGIVKIQQI